MGSLTTTEDHAYIAGFLDGDGSLMLQIKKRSDTKRGWRIMATICFYQDSRHEAPLYWIQKKLGIGYISQRNDGITELRVNGFETVRTILNKLIPYIRFKKLQAAAIWQACNILTEKDLRFLTQSDREKLFRCLMIVQENNYITHRKKSAKELRLVVGLTP